MDVEGIISEVQRYLSVQHTRYKHITQNDISHLSDSAECVNKKPPGVILHMHWDLSAVLTDNICLVFIVLAYIVLAYIAFFSFLEKNQKSVLFDLIYFFQQ